MKKNTLIFSLLMIFCFGVNAQVLKVSDAPANGVWSDNTTWYFIQNKKGGVVSTDAAYCNTEGKLRLHNSTIPTENYAKALWCIVGDETNGYKFYNKADGAGKVLLASRELDDDAAKFCMADAENAAGEYFDIANSQKSGYIIVKDHNNENNYWNNRGDNLAYWNSTSATNDDGSSFHFVEAAPVVAALDFIEESEAQYTLQVTPIDLKNNTDMLYCNAPCTNTSWGDQFEGHWEYLFDDNAATILHTEYGNATSVDALDHYIRVDMGENNTIGALQFTIGTRANNCTVNSPTTIVVEGCNSAGGEYEVIKTVTGIPQQNSYTYTSAVLSNGNAYRYIRFRVTATGSNQTDGGGKVFFFIAEFGMSSATEVFSVKPEYVQYTDEIKALSLVVENTTGTVKDYATRVAPVIESLDRVIRPDYYVLYDKIEALNKYIANRGEAVGLYNVSDDFVAAFEAAVAVLNASASTASDYQVSLAALNELEVPTTINLPTEGTFYVLYNPVAQSYVYSKTVDNKIYHSADVTNASVWQFVKNDDGSFKLYNVNNGQYLKGLTWTVPSLLGDEACKVELVSSEVEGKGYVLIKGAGQQMHAQLGGENAVVYYNEGTGLNKSSWEIKEFEGTLSHTLTVGTAGYATLMLGYNTTIPAIDGEGYGVFTAVVNGDWATLTKVEGVLPANTAVIVKAPAGDYVFDYTTETATADDNDLRGTLYNKNMTDAAYVLGIVDNEVGLYTAANNVSTDTSNDDPEVTYEAWLNNANKAYLPKPAGNNVSFYGFRFDEEENTTGIEVVENANENVIYDLAGRRVSEITEKGIYIIDGHKVLVK